MFVLIRKHACRNRVPIEVVTSDTNLHSVSYRHIIILKIPSKQLNGDSKHLSTSNGKCLLFGLSQLLGVHPITEIWMHIWWSKSYVWRAHVVLFRLLKCVMKKGLILNLATTEFCKQEIHIVRHVISALGITPLKDKISIWIPK